MSITAVTESPREGKYGYAEQAAYGTAELDTAAFVEVDCEPTVVNRDIKLVELPGSHGSRERHSNNIKVVGKACLPFFTTEMVVKKEELADFLAAFFQSVVEGELTPWDKTFTMHDSQPDFQSDAGFFYTWIVRDAAASKSVKVADCILRALTFTIAGGADPVKISAEWVGLGLADVTSNPSGTWTPNGNSNLFFREDIDRVTVDFGSGDVSFHLVEAEISLSREIIGVGQNGSGQHSLVHLANPVHSGKLKLVKDTDWGTARSNHAAGTEIDINLGWGNAIPGTDDGDFDIACHATIDGPGGEELEHDEPMAGTLNCHLCKTSADESITVVTADGVEKTW